MERREPGASPSSLFVAAIDAGVGDVLRRGGEDEGTQLGGTNQWVGNPLAIVGGRGQGLTHRLSTATTSLTGQWRPLAASVCGLDLTATGKPEGRGGPAAGEAEDRPGWLGEGGPKEGPE